MPKRYEILVDARKPGSSASLMVNGRPALTLNKAGSLANKYSVPDMLVYTAPPSTPEKHRPVPLTWSFGWWRWGHDGRWYGRVWYFQWPVV